MSSLFWGFLKKIKGGVKMKSKKLSYNKILVLFSIIVVLVLMTGCSGGAPPIVNIFSAIPSTINQGENSTLTWSVSDATTVTITPDVGTVALSGSTPVSPAVTTNYILAATNSAGSVTATATLLVNPFLGYWINEDPNTNSITKIDIQENNNLLEIYMWGKCHPTDCDWAAMNNPEGPAITTVDDAYDGVLNIVWYPDFAIETQEITYLGGDRLEVYTFTHFTDNSGRLDYERYDYFIKSN